jgi:hypothetical protein
VPEFELLSVPKVQLTTVLFSAVFNGTTDPTAQPLIGTPVPLYNAVGVTHPFVEELNDNNEDIFDVIHNPAIPDVELIFNGKFDIPDLVNLNVKYCDPVLPVLRLGPVGI